MALYIVSDIHLDKKAPYLYDAFFNYIATLADDAQALFILGDLFEYWIGDDDPSEHIHRVGQCLAELKQHRHIPVYFQHGNRDFLLGNSYASRYGIEILPETYILTHAKQQFLLCHGDALCTDDTDYMAFRAQTRKPQWQQHVLSLDIEERIQLAASMRQQSQQAMQSKVDDIMDVNQHSVEQFMLENNCSHLIHGHTHRPAQHQFVAANETLYRTVLGDWRADKAWQVRIDANGANLSDFYYSTQNK